jgi:hypothetical protein
MIGIARTTRVSATAFRRKRLLDAFALYVFGNGFELSPQSLESPSLAGLRCAVDRDKLLVVIHDFALRALNQANVSKVASNDGNCRNQQDQAHITNRCHRGHCENEKDPREK